MCLLGHVGSKDEDKIISGSLCWVINSITMAHLKVLMTALIVRTLVLLRSFIYVPTSVDKKRLSRGFPEAFIILIALFSYIF